MLTETTKSSSWLVRSLFVTNVCLILQLSFLLLQLCDLNWLHTVLGHRDILTTLSVPIASFQFCPSIFEHKHEAVHRLPFEN
jgi:hypothetical protein